MCQEKSFHPVAETAIRRKIDAAGAPPWRRRDWIQAYGAFLAGLARARFCTLVADYDGTLCDGTRRDTGISGKVVGMLTKMLEGGLVVGVATGRGKSVRDDLRRKLHQSLWSRIVVGYHNGFQVTTLEDDCAPSSNQHPGPHLEPLVAALGADPRLQRRIRLTPRFALVSVEPLSSLSERSLWEIIQELIRRLGLDDQGLATVRSTYSLDIVAPGTSKLNVVRRALDMARVGGQPTALCVGDRGCWPGNDHELLKQPHALSVDEVSANPASCWNLAPPGQRGEAALLWHLRTALIRDGSLVVDPAAWLATEERGRFQRVIDAIPVSALEAE